MLLTRPRCPLCDEARAELAGVAAELGFEWAERVVAGDEESEYGDRVPVLLLDGREHSFWRIDVPRLRRDLSTHPD